MTDTVSPRRVDDSASAAFSGRAQGAVHLTPAEAGEAANVLAQRRPGEHGPVRIYTGLVTALGVVLFVALFPHPIASPSLLALLLTLSCVTSVWVLRFGILGSGAAMSLGYAIDFTSLLLLGPHETMLVAAGRAFCQSSFRVKEPASARQTLFSTASAVVTVQAAGLVYGWLGGGLADVSDPALLIRPLLGAALTYFIVHTLSVATAIALAARQPIDRVWGDRFLWTAPPYAVGAAGAALTMWVIAAFPSRWVVLLAAVPLYLGYRTYNEYVRRLQAAERQSRELADLHLATIEALAVAIDAKNQKSPSHVRRVQLYAASVAQAMGMSAPEVQGVRTAALLHDIGNLAIPEHILSKAGLLTSEEIQKLRAHPKVGADIVSSVPFPYPVAPLILGHHERWDGKGYPDGLKGRETPLGARILFVVDSFDVWMTERQDEGPRSYDDCVALLRAESGKAFDPDVVSTFVALLPSLQIQAAGLQERTGDADRLDQQVTGPVAVRPRPETPQTNVFEDIALAHQEIYALYDIAQAMGTSLGVADTMALITSKLSRLVPYSCVALFLQDEGTQTLKCRFAVGIDADIIRRVIIPNGKGVTGWVARNRRPLVNAPPAADFDAAGIKDAGSSLKSALICPLISSGKLIGTLSVYHVEAAFFREDHRRLLDRVSEQAAAVINNSILFDQTQADSLTDTLTGLPNTRHLFTHLTGELARAQRLGTEVALLIMDLDNFKEINDTHGHHVGDRALCEVARVLQAAIRPYDLCVRYAGDEFIVVLSGCSIEEAELKRGELQKGVQDVAFEAQAGRPLQLGLSVGIAIFSRDGDSYETLLATADSRMYQDKAGRKRAAAAPDDTAVVLNAHAS